MTLLLTPGARKHATGPSAQAGGALVPWPEAGTILLSGLLSLSIRQLIRSENTDLALAQRRPPGKRASLLSAHVKLFFSWLRKRPWAHRTPEKIRINRWLDRWWRATTSGRWNFMRHQHECIVVCRIWISALEPDSRRGFGGACAWRYFHDHRPALARKQSAHPALEASRIHDAFRLRARPAQ